MKIAIALLLSLSLSSTLALAAQEKTPAAAQRPTPTSQERAKPWVADALQIGDVKKREAAIETIRAAIKSTDAAEALAGLFAFNQIHDVDFDKKSFRDVVLPHLADKDSSARLSAMYALNLAGRESGDLERVLAAVDGVQGPERPRLVHVISLFTGGDLSGKGSETVLSLISGDDPRELRQSLSGLWGTKVSPAIEQRLLALANGKDPGLAHDGIYFGLSTLKDKSEPVIDRLIAALADPDSNNSGRALWGLGQGVVPALEPKVADAMLQLFEARGDSQSRSSSLRLLQQYGSERHAKALDEIAAKPAIAAELATQVRETAAAIRARTPLKK
ncbi:MAG TPA: hypothetical protein VM509_13550 [Planctomycetota bacterium]|nr:hypothetical protein [Planctomycetota bacterium]